MQTQISVAVYYRIGMMYNKGMTELRLAEWAERTKITEIDIEVLSGLLGMGIFSVSGNDRDVSSTVRNQLWTAGGETIGVETGLVSFLIQGMKLGLIILPEDSYPAGYSPESTYNIILNESARDPLGDKVYRAMKGLFADAGTLEEACEHAGVNVQTVRNTLSLSAKDNLAQELGIKMPRDGSVALSWMIKALAVGEYLVLEPSGIRSTEAMGF